MPSPGADARGATKTGDLVQLDFELWAEAAGKTELLDTTREEVAQAAGFPRVEGHVWGPRPHEIGGEFFPRGIETSLVGVPVGDEVEREFAPGDAFGERDPDLIELFSRHEIQRLPEMRREDAHLELGSVLTIEGRRGRVVTLTEARVRVDFNPPFAGRRVKGKFRIAEKIAEPAEQVRAIVELQYGHSHDFHVELREKTFTLRVPERAKFDPRWILAKAQIVDRLRNRLHPESVRIVEEYATPAAPPKPAAAAGAHGKASAKAAPAAEAGAAAEPTSSAPEADATPRTGGSKRSPPAAPPET
jgi:FKBP-type peptidyl-prolyl cis-trans isomerase 2